MGREVIDLSKKIRTADDYMRHLYIHTNELNQFVIFSGLNLQDFIFSVDQLGNLLLLKNIQNSEEGSFNMHTRLAFVEQNELTKFSKQMSDKKSDLCWIDFSDEKKLNLLTPQEQAELLYIGHKKEPIRSPFYHQLQNRFVYLESKSEKFTKVYVRDLEEVSQIVTRWFNHLIQMKERSLSFWRRKPLSRIPHYTATDYEQIREDAKDGILLSLYRVEKPKVAYVLEVRNVADIQFPDEIWDDLNAILKHDATTMIQANIH